LKHLRNDQVFELLPIGVMVFAGTGNSGENDRQDTEARHPRLEIRQRWRVSATVSPTEPLSTEPAKRQCPLCTVTANLAARVRPDCSGLKPGSLA
jgi:hypothetical protein